MAASLGIPPLKGAVARAKALLVGVSLAALSCGQVSAVPRAVSLDATLASRRWPETTVAELNRGRSLYVARCAGCHQLKPPGSLGPAAWEEQVAKMRDEHEVALSDAEQLLLVKYLFAVASRPEASSR